MESVTRKMLAKREQVERLTSLGDGTYWEQLDWPVVRTILAGARYNADCPFYHLPDVIVQRILHLSHKPRWKPKWSKGTKLNVLQDFATGKFRTQPRDSFLEKGTKYSFRCRSFDDDIASYPYVTIDGTGTQYIELCLSYVETSLPTAERKAHLLAHFGFECGCTRCAKE